MRNWRNWLLPLLTGLAVACLTVLPPRLSAVGDRKLMGVVHPEELGEDSNFPARPPELPGRIWLLAKRDQWPDDLTLLDDALESEELVRVSGQVQAELSRLEEAGILPPALAKGFENFGGNRVFVRDQTDLSSAGFLEVTAHQREPGCYLWMCLDGESGRTLSLLLSPYGKFRPFAEDGIDIEAVGTAFLDDLGVGYEEEAVELSDRFAVFRLTESKVFYQFSLWPDYLQIAPQVDWEQVDETNGSMYDAAYGLG